jgi:hypothetical protein
LPCRVEQTHYGGSGKKKKKKKKKKMEIERALRENKAAHKPPAPL